MRASRRVQANRRRWQNPPPIIRVPRARLTQQEADAIREKFAAAQRHRSPILLTGDIEVYR